MEIKRVPASVYAEVTPNPTVMKFVANKVLLTEDSVEFKNIDEAQPSPLAQKLFHFPFVKEVFITGNFVAITKFNVVEWEDVTLEIREFITNWIAEDKPVYIAPAVEETAAEEEAQPEAEVVPEGEIETRIVEILNEYVRPAVEQDGGNIKFMAYEDKIVKVLLQGACSGCPSSTMTLKSGILNILQKMLPTLVTDVEAVNG
jgi:Fe-S cluster biogenesis protein NfuA